MEVLFGFEAEKKFYKIGSVIEVMFKDGMYCDGTLDDIRIEENAIVVDGVIIRLERITQVNHKMNDER